MPRSPELLLLSSVIRNDDFATVLGANLLPEMFYTHREEFEFLATYFRKYHKMPSKAAFRQQFPEFALMIVDDTGWACEKVVEAHTRQQLLGAANDLASFIQAGDIEGAVKHAHKQIIAIAASVGGAGDVDILSHYDELIASAQAKSERVLKGGYAGIPSGMPTIDNNIGGAQPGQFILLAGRLGSGKSWFVNKWASTALIWKKRVQLDTLEMTREEVSFRLHGLLSGASGEQVFSNMDLQQGHNFNPVAYRAFCRKLAKTFAANGASLHIADRSHGPISPMSIAAQIERNNPDIVFVDIVTQLQGAHGGDWQAVGAVSSELKALAQQYMIPIVGTVQLNREAGMSQDPGPEAIAKSDQLGQDADGVVIIRKASDSVATGKIAKWRHGGHVGFKFWIETRPTLGVWEECSYDRAMELKDIDMTNASEAEHRATVDTTKHRFSLLDDDEGEAFGTAAYASTGKSPRKPTQPLRGLGKPLGTRRT